MHHFSSNLFENHSHGRTLAFFFMVLSLYHVCVCVLGRTQEVLGFMGFAMAFVVVAFFVSRVVCVRDVCVSFSFVLLFHHVY